MTFVNGPVTVTVPATSANLGPGFDALGIALSWRDRLEGEVIADGLVVEVEGEGAEAVPLDETHLVVRAMRVCFDAMGVVPPGLRLSCRNVIPHARGLGSSSAAIVGGVALARELVAAGPSLLDDDAVFRLAAALEGHPDNVAPAALGGFVISGFDESLDDFYAVAGDLDPAISAVVLIPPDGVETTLARGLLPDQVSHRDAATNAGRAALLVAALAGRPAELWRATEDRLHQEFRRPAMPQTLELVATLRASGVPALVSGAGPTVLAFSDGADTPRTEAILAACPEGWAARHVFLDARGIVSNRSVTEEAR